MNGVVYGACAFSTLICIDIVSSSSSSDFLMLSLLIGKLSNDLPFAVVVTLCVHNEITDIWSTNDRV